MKQSQAPLYRWGSYVVIRRSRAEYITLNQYMDRVQNTILVIASHRRCWVRLFLCFTLLYGGSASSMGTQCEGKIDLTSQTTKNLFNSNSRVHSSVNPGNYCGMTRLALGTRRSAVSLFNAGYSVAAIQQRLHGGGRRYSYKKEPVSSDKKFKEMGCGTDLPRRARDKKLTQEIY